MPRCWVSSWIASTRLEYQNLFSLARGGTAGQVLDPRCSARGLLRAAIARQLSLPPFSIVRLEMLGSDVYGLLLAAAWLLSAGRQSTIWWSGRAESRV